jgi:hypothetical protein
LEMPRGRLRGRESLSPRPCGGGAPGGPRAGNSASERRLYAGPVQRQNTPEMVQYHRRRPELNSPRAFSSLPPHCRTAPSGAGCCQCGSPSGRGPHVPMGRDIDDIRRSVQSPLRWKGKSLLSQTTCHDSCRLDCALHSALNPPLRASPSHSMPSSYASPNSGHWNIFRASMYGGEVMKLMLKERSRTPGQPFSPRTGTETIGFSKE